MKLTRSLSFRLLVGIFVMMVIGITIVTLVLADMQAERYTEYYASTAARVSDIIKRSTHYSMMLNRREDIYQIITTIGTEPGIEGIRIYNKRGDITFSTDSSQTGRTVDLTAEACVVCHAGGIGDGVTPQNPQLVRTFRSPNGYRVMGVITPIKNEPGCDTPACHAHSPSQTILGVLDVMVPLDELDRNIARFEQAYVFGGLSMIVFVTGLAGLFFWRTVNVPVKRLKEGTERIIQGRLDHTIDVRTTDELGALTTSFNTMTRTLKQAQDELEELNRTLERRVEQKTEELRRAQANLVQVEKMVSLGTLAATVAHELNNPLEGVLTYAKLIRKRMQAGELTAEQKADVLDELKMIADETARCGSIVKNLLIFSRRKVGEMKPESLRAVVDQSLKLMAHHFAMNNIRPVTRFAEPEAVLVCDAEQLLQALLALQINAVEAMPQGGDLTVSVLRTAAGDAAVTVSDTGTGIRAEDLPHIFEPFFTTKREGKGTGLGLAVVYGIVKNHGGSVTVDASPGGGTVFTLTFPLRPGADAPDAARA